MSGGKWEVKGKGLVKEESRDVVVEWPSDECDPLGEDEIEEDEELPPIDVDTLQDPLGRINAVFNYFTTYPGYVR